MISELFFEHVSESTVLRWPPQSTVLNPVEHLWDVVQQTIQSVAASASVEAKIVSEMLGCQC